jgi:pimeloyl-ACP methyl ester carboxylesterase
MNTHLKTQKHRWVWWITGLILLGSVLVVGTFAAGTVARSKLMKQYPAPGQLVDVDGHKMHIFCMGQGSPTVLLAAGLDDFSVMWSRVQPDVAKTTRVCSYDRSGLGWSEPGPDPRTSETMVKELHLLLVNSKSEAPYILVGHSFGGALMRMYARNYPGEVAGMVLVDAAPDDLFIRIPQWRKAVDGKLGLYRKLAPLGSFGLLAFTPGSIPNRGMPADVLAQYRAIAVSTAYFQTGIAENEAFESNLADIRAANLEPGDMPLRVISRGYWDPIPGFSEAENQKAWLTWQAMQADYLSLSAHSSQTIATESEHSVQLQQPQLVVDAITDILKECR